MNTPNKWDRPEFVEYDFGTHVHCDGCGAAETYRSWGFDTAEARRGRALAAIVHVRALGWSVEGEEQRCPMCAVRTPPFADGTAPGTQTVESVGPDGEEWAWRDRGPTR